MGKLVCAAVPVNCWPSFNAGLSETTLNIFSVSKFATSGSFILPNEISHSEQQQVKRKDYEVQQQKIKGRAKQNIVGLITVEKFELAKAVNNKLNKT